LKAPLTPPQRLFDYKFGQAGLTTDAINQIRAAASLSPSVTVIEVRP